MAGGNKIVNTKLKGDILSYPVAIGTAIHRGAMVTVNAGGFAIMASDTVSTFFAGIAETENTVAEAVADGTMYTKVRRRGIFKMTLKTPAVAPTLVGDVVYVNTTQTATVDELVDVAANVTNHVLVGKIVKHGTDAEAIAGDTSSEVWIDIMGIQDTSNSSTYTTVASLSANTAGSGAQLAGVENATGFGTSKTVQDAFEALLAGFIGIPLNTLKESDGTNMTALTGATTPILDMLSGDPDSAITLTWAASNSDAVIFQVPLPPQIDVTSSLVVHFRAKMGGATDTPTISSDSYFNEGDTKVSDISTACNAAWAEETVTIAASDIPTGAQTFTCELTPGAHTTDALIVSALWLEFVKTYA